MNEKRLLNELKRRQAEYALSTLQRPANKDLFEYGHRCGVVEGYELAINEVIRLVKEENDDGSQL